VSEHRSERQRAKSAANGAVGVIRYRERLRTPWWWYPLGIGVASLLAAEFHISGLPLTDWIPLGVLVPAAILIIWALGRGELAISDDELRIRGAHISLRYISGAVALAQRSQNPTSQGGRQTKNCVQDLPTGFIA
jgi:hypothetical protein